MIKKDHRFRIEMSGMKCLMKIGLPNGLMKKMNDKERLLYWQDKALPEMFEILFGASQLMKGHEDVEGMVDWLLRLRELNAALHRDYAWLKVRLVGGDKE